MAHKYTRMEVLERIQREIAAGRSVLATGAGCGLSAKSQERGGTDLIIVYNSGKFRINGLASIVGNLPLSDANALVYEMGEKSILPVVLETPVIAGVFGVDPTRNMYKFLKSLSELGYSGIINFPTVGRLGGDYRRDLDNVGLTFEKEAEMMELAHDLDMFTMSYVFKPEEAARMAKADVDILVPHCGLTGGGFIGAKETITMEEAVQSFNELYDAARVVKPDIIALAHGGPIASVEDVEWFVNHTSAAGFVAASSIERLPVEKAVSETARSFKRIGCKNGKVSF